MWKSGNGHQKEKRLTLSMKRGKKTKGWVILEVTRLKRIVMDMFSEAVPERNLWEKSFAAGKLPNKSFWWRLVKVLLLA